MTRLCWHRRHPIGEGSRRFVLDSVSSPITKRVYNLGLDEFFEWCGVGGPWTRVDLDQRADHGRAQAGGRGRRQRTAARIGRRDRTHQRGKIQGRPWGTGCPSDRPRCF
jgi:hypothetical protein